MIQIKKTILTLALLLTAVTGAWADQLASSYSSNATLNAVTVSASMEVTIATGVTVTINNGLNITSGTLTVKGPGTLVVNGKAGSNGYNNDDGDGGPGGNGGVAISGNIIVQGGATVKATGGNGGNGGNSYFDTGGNGAQGGAAITGEVTIQDASTLEATGGNGGKGGNGEGDAGNGGNGGNAFAGTLTYKGGTVTADGGNGGSGGSVDYGDNGSGGSAGKAFTTSVNFVSSDYILTDGSNAITATQVTSKKKVVINPKVAVNSVTLAPTAASMTVGGETLTLTATVAPTNATDPTVKWNVTAGADKVKLYKDENCSTEVGTAATDVLTVYAKCLAVGEATVTVTSNDDATKTAACTVTVIQPGPEVAWDKAKKTGTFTMPGGNVTLEPEYYPQATVADGGVTAADADARATTDDPLVKVDATKLTGAKKLMYFVSNSGTTAPAYDAEGWTDQLPTAEGFTQQGIVYVWYYPVGTDEGVDGATATYSDGDMNATALTVSLGAAPLWNAEFDLTDAPEADKAGKWSSDIPEGGVVKGTPVTVTYTGTKKVIGVKAEKKADVPVTAITLNKTTTTIYKVNDSSTETLSVTAVTPDEATDKTYTWSSDNTAVATVDASTGEVTAVAVGTAHIRATANDGSGVYGECTVTVSDLSAYYSKMKECGCGDLTDKCANDFYPNSPFTGQVLSADQAIALAKAKAAETSSNCAVFYDNSGDFGGIKFAKNDGTTGSAFFEDSASEKGLSGYRGFYVSK